MTCCATASGWRCRRSPSASSDWNEPELESFLIEISARVLAKTDEATGQPLVDVILDAAEQKGTGRWTAQDALELGVPLTGITEAVFARTLSALEGPARGTPPSMLAGPSRRSAGDDGWPTTSSTRCTRPRSSPTPRASRRWRPPPTPRAGTSTWARWPRSGVAAASSARASSTASARPTTPNPTWPTSCWPTSSPDALENAQDPWRRVVGEAAELGIPTPAFSSSLAYYDGYRRARGPASLIQGLRDLFGAHTYKRVDRDGTYHVRWGDDGSEVEV